MRGCWERGGEGIDEGVIGGTGKGGRGVYERMWPVGFLIYFSILHCDDTPSFFI